ncbi:hypothetical protein ANN_03804 [Periplaneta americana]|uniref:Ionotropic receptor n=1 Tax=Periplaneta americana TaxID=6978 RepID=A0ABQ8U4M6_PERAM|nr:hypothetical protein ANN_03804 [Periplaneta americana]
MKRKRKSRRGEKSNFAVRLHNTSIVGTYPFWYEDHGEQLVTLRCFINCFGYLASERYESDNVSEMNPGSSAESWLFNDAVSTTRLFSVDGIGEREMIFGEMRPRIRHRLPSQLGKTSEKTQPGLSKHKVSQLKDMYYIIITPLQDRRLKILQETEKQLHALKSRSSWNARGLFVMLISERIYRDKFFVGNVLQLLWKFKVPNIQVIVPDSNSSLALFTWYPYQSDELFKRVSEIKLDSWLFEPVGHFESHKNLYPSKIPNDLNGREIGASTLEIKPYVFLSQTETSEIVCKDGLEARLFHLMMKAMNATYHLKLPGFQHQIQNVEELITSNVGSGYHKDYSKYFQDATDETLTKIKTRSSHCEGDGMDCLQRMINKGDFAILSSEHLVDFQTTCMKLGHSSEPKFYRFPDEFLGTYFVMYLTKGSPLLERVNNIISRTVEAGLLEQWRNEMMTSLTLKCASGFKDQTLTLSLSHLLSAFVFGFIGYGISLITFFAELLCFYVRRKYLKKFKSGLSANDDSGYNCSANDSDERAFSIESYSRTEDIQLHLSYVNYIEAALYRTVPPLRLDTTIPFGSTQFKISSPKKRKQSFHDWKTPRERNLNEESRLLSGNRRYEYEQNPSNSLVEIAVHRQTNTEIIFHDIIPDKLTRRYVPKDFIICSFVILDSVLYTCRRENEC